MLTKQKDSPLQIKSISAAGTFEGFGSVYGNTDSYGDIVMPGAFTDTIRENGGDIILLNQHDPAQPIGKGKLKDESYGLKVYGSLNLDLQVARDVHSNMKKGILKGLSIGYRTLLDRFDPVRKVNELLKLRLLEISAVTFAANDLATITSAKRATAAGAGSSADVGQALKLLTAQTARFYQVAGEYKAASRAPNASHWYREVASADVSPERAVAAERALRWIKSHLGVTPAIRWIKPEAASTAKFDYGKTAWPRVYYTYGEITGQAWLNDDIVLLRSDLDPVVVTRTVLHEGRHLADVKLLGLPYINANRKYSEQRAAEYEEAHWRGLMY